MKLLIVLLFVFPLSAQAGHHKHKRKKSDHSYHNHKKVKRYLTVGAVFNVAFFDKEGEKTSSYSVKLGKGYIIKRKYDLSFVLGYNKNGDNKDYSFGVDAKYLFHGKRIQKFHPYLGVGVDFSKKTDLEKKAKLIVGNRFPIGKNMMADLAYNYFKANKKDIKTKGSDITLSWNYFF